MFIRLLRVATLGERERERERERWGGGPTAVWASVYLTKSTLAS